MDFKIPAERLGLEIEEYLELVELFLETGANDLKELEDAIAGNNIQAVVERSHSIKGASGNLGINEIYEIAKDIESKARDNSLEGIDDAVLKIKQYLEEIIRLLEKKE